MTPPDDYQVWHCKREGYDSVLFTKVNFLHRTATEFLLNNDEAKAFLAHNGSHEAQVRRSIARGILAQISQHSQEDAGFDYGLDIDDFRSPYVFDSFRIALQQVSIVERLVGAAQTKLMHSLIYGSLVQRLLVIDRSRSYETAFNYFKITGDLVGLAAKVGMTLYVCEKLDLSVKLKHFSPSLPTSEDHSMSRTVTTTLSWNGPEQLQDSESGTAIRSASSSYRQALGESLQWKLDHQSDSWTDAWSGRYPFAETYTLACCAPRNLDLVRILLRAGANPMVEVKLLDNPSVVSGCKTKSFWESWLKFLDRCRGDYVRKYGKSGGLVLSNDDIQIRITLSGIFDTTKALLANGADINPQMERTSSRNVKCYLKRRDLGDEQLYLILTASAMFTLEECFGKEPEFREFAAAVEPLVEAPTRKITGIFYTGRYDHGKYESGEVYPTDEELEFLWPLVERWESTGNRRDLDALQTTMRSILRVHIPGFLLQEHSTDSALTVANSTEL